MNRQQSAIVAVIVTATLILGAVVLGNLYWPDPEATPVDVAQQPEPQAETASAPGNEALAENAENILVIEIAGEGATGEVRIELRPDLAPLHVARIKRLARDGAYDGIVFHRVIDGFMAQTGDVQFGHFETGNVNRAGTGGSDLPDLVAEFTSEPYLKGVVGAARSQSPNSANSQFFIMFDEGRFLDNNYTVFGRVIAGQDVVDQIKRGHPRSGQITGAPDYMKRVRILTDG